MSTPTLRNQYLFLVKIVVSQKIPCPFTQNGQFKNSRLLSPDLINRHAFFSEIKIMRKWHSAILLSVNFSIRFDMLNQAIHRSLQWNKLVFLDFSICICLHFKFYLIISFHDVKLKSTMDKNVISSPREHQLELKSIKKNLKTSTFFFSFFVLKKRY